LRHIGWILVLALVTGCGHRKLKDRIEALESRVNTLEGFHRGPPPDTRSPVERVQDSAEIRGLLARAQSAEQEGDVTGALGIARLLLDEHPDSAEAADARRIVDELGIVGQPAGPLEVTTWIQGRADIASGTHFLVFFEPWCTPCKSAVPSLRDRVLPKNASVVLLTRMTRDATTEQVEEFLVGSQLSYPTGQESGTMSERYRVRGIPAVVLVKNGVIVWRGHPDQLVDPLLSRLLAR
jgi:thiol-disulfide isomerase/thioredoxin